MDRERVHSIIPMYLPSRCHIKGMIQQWGSRREMQATLFIPSTGVSMPSVLFAMTRNTLVPMQKNGIELSSAYVVIQLYLPRRDPRIGFVRGKSSLMQQDFTLLGQDALLSNLQLAIWNLHDSSPTSFSFSRSFISMAHGHLGVGSAEL